MLLQILTNSTRLAVQNFLLYEAQSFIILNAEKVFALVFPTARKATRSTICVNFLFRPPFERGKGKTKQRETEALTDSEIGSQ